MFKTMKVVSALAAVVLAAVVTLSSPVSAQSARRDCAPGQPSGRPPGTPPNQPGPPDGRPPQYPPGRCQLALSQSSAARGDSFQASGGGFEPGEQVTLRIAGRNAATAIAGSDGVFAATLTVPGDAAFGRTQVLASGRSQELAADFEVIRPAAAAGAAPARSSGALPRTGAESTAVALFGVVLTAGGLLLVQATRRRREASAS